MRKRAQIVFVMLYTHFVNGTNRNFSAMLRSLPKPRPLDKFIGNTFLELFTERSRRVETCLRVLKHNSNFSSHHFSALLNGHAQQVLTVPAHSVSS